MKFFRLLVMAIAVGAGIMAFRIVMDNQPTGVMPAAVEVVQETQILVAANDIMLGGKVTGSDISWVEWPESAVPVGALTRRGHPAAVDNFIGQIAKTRVYAGEPIRSEKFIDTDKGYMAAILPKGKRAIAVRVEEETSAGGFILPDDKVDVILTRKHSERNVSSDTILENIRVLAIDSTTAGEQESKNLSPKRTATLELTLQESEIIVQAQQVGSIALALRSAEDSGENAVVKYHERRDANFVRVQPDRWSVGVIQVK
jgi:pilus assembly protein CpaB